MIGVGKGSSLPNPGSQFDTLMNSPLMQTVQGKNQAPEMAGNTANLDLLKMLKGNGDYWARQGNADHWRAQGQFNGEPQPADQFRGPAPPTIQPRQRSANQQSDLVNVEELLRRRLGWK